MIPYTINREHILEAIKETERNGVPHRRGSTKFSLIHNNKSYPPKYVVSLACKYATGKELGSSVFSGGIETNTFLNTRGFTVVEEFEGSKPKDTVRDNQLEKEHQKKRKHNERCPHCKVTIKKLLEICYGKVKDNHKFHIGSHPDVFKQYSCYEVLKEIFQSLQRYRGFDNFVKSKTLPNCDFFVPNPGFVVEFDESQHFTAPRRLALERYPENLKLGFNKNIFITRCISLNKRDNNPPYRDEQRAWYDTLRDFIAIILNIPVVRLLPDEYKWCDFDANDLSHIDLFKNHIEMKLNNLTTNNTDLFKIGLVFPELGIHNFKYFHNLIKTRNNNIDLLIFPEGFETIHLNRSTKPENIKNDTQIKKLIEKYYSMCRKFKLSIIVGIQVDYSNTSRSGGDNDQYCLCIESNGISDIYHKHSTSRFNAFYDDNWSIKNNFKILNAGIHKIGISICHDSYISLISRVLKKKGANIWVNISYQNVRTRIWEAVHQARAVTNGFIALCTLHRNSNKSNQQKEPYAFAQNGKIKLIDLESDLYIEEIPENKRAGKIYCFDTYNYDLYPQQRHNESDIAKNAEQINIRLDPKGDYDIRCDKCDYQAKEICISDFIYSPEIMWDMNIKNQDKVFLFIITVNDENEWNKYQADIQRIIKGRVIEFSTLFVFRRKNQNMIFMAAYRSSNYKDSRVFYPKAFPITFDRRFLKGLESTIAISRDSDYRNKNENIYYDRLSQILNYLKITS